MSLIGIASPVWAGSWRLTPPTGLGLKRNGVPYLKKYPRCLPSRPLGAGEPSILVGPCLDRMVCGTVDRVAGMIDTRYLDVDVSEQLLKRPIHF